MQQGTAGRSASTSPSATGPRRAPRRRAKNVGHGSDDDPRRLDRPHDREPARRHVDGRPARSQGLPRPADPADRILGRRHDRIPVRLDSGRRPPVLEPPEDRRASLRLADRDRHDRLDGLERGAGDLRERRLAPAARAGRERHAPGGHGGRLLARRLHGARPHQASDDVRPARGRRQRAADRSAALGRRRRRGRRSHRPLAPRAPERPDRQLLPLRRRTARPDLRPA